MKIIISKHHPASATHPYKNTELSPNVDALGVAPLVNAHISPHDPIQKGHIDLYASRFDILPSKIKRQQGRIGGGLRGVVSRFSYGARRRMQTSLAGIQGQHYQTMLFLTLTYHDDWQGREPRKDLDAYIKRLRRRHPDLAYVWRLEPQKRLAPHFHLLLFFTYRLTELQKAEMSNNGTSWSSQTAHFMSYTGRN